jgi:hypothetical protein
MGRQLHLNAAPTELGFIGWPESINKPRLTELEATTMLSELFNKARAIKGATAWAAVGCVRRLESRRSFSKIFLPRDSRATYQ